MIVEGSPMADETLKTCVRCNQQQPIEAFHSARNRPDGRYPYCRACCKTIRADRASSDPEGEQARRLRKQTYDAAYNTGRKDKKAAQVRSRYQAKSAEIKAYIRAWQQKNAPLVRAYKASSKAKRRAACGDGVSGAALLAWAKGQAKRCYWCGVGCAKRFHVDHYVPLAKGGAHELTNLVISCPTCNLRKHAKAPMDFAREVGRLL
jgi:5-methylcytosine-specific restriction endonuclease McrA